MIVVYSSVWLTIWKRNKTWNLQELIPVRNAFFWCSHETQPFNWSESFFFFFLFYQNNTSYHHILDVDHASFTKLGNYPFLKIFLSYHYYLNSKESGLVSFVLVVNFVQNNISIWRQKVNFIRIKLCMSCMVNFPPLNWTIWPYSLTVYPLC